MEKWRRKLIGGVFKRPGTHVIEIGRSGSGKTQGLYYLLDGLNTYGEGKNTIVWIDTGKSSEFLTLAKFRPLHILLPMGCNIEYRPAPDTERLDLKVTHLTDIADVWHNLDSSRINVVCFSRFVRDHAAHAKIVSKLFRALIDAAYDYQVPIPMEVFIDEFQFICPAKHVAMSREHYKAGLDVVNSLWTMRSLGVRFVAAAQSWKVIVVASRDSFDWVVIRRGAEFSEGGKMRDFNLLWSKTPTDGCYIVYPDRNFSDAMIHLPFYGDGIEWGRVMYHGKLTPTAKS